MTKKNTTNSSTKQSDENNIQDKLMKMQMLDQQSKQLQKYIENFDEQLVGVRSLIDAISEFGKYKGGEEIYAPLANGIFIKAKIEKPSNLLVNVGNDVVVEKTIGETIILLEGQESEIKKFREDALEQLSKITSELGDF